MTLTLIDGEREDAEHQVAEHLGVAAHPHVAPAEVTLRWPLTRSAALRSL
jgi:hypothetical protein